MAYISKTLLYPNLTSIFFSVLLRTEFPMKFDQKKKKNRMYVAKGNLYVKCTLDPRTGCWLLVKNLLLLRWKYQREYEYLVHIMSWFLHLMGLHWKVSIYAQYSELESKYALVPTSVAFKIKMLKLCFPTLCCETVFHFSLWGKYQLWNYAITTGLIFYRFAV